jgi:hypothetical protein
MDRLCVAYTESAAKTGWRESGDGQRVRAQFNEWARHHGKKQRSGVTPGRRQ